MTVSVIEAIACAIGKFKLSYDSLFMSLQSWHVCPVFVNWLTIDPPLVIVMVLPRKKSHYVILLVLFATGAMAAAQEAAALGH